MSGSAGGTVNVHVLILAAGASRRFGSDKRQAVLPTGRNLLQQVCHVVAASGLPYSVVSRRHDVVSTQFPSVISVDNAAGGMGSTIAEAVSQLGAGIDGVMLLPVDLPLLRSHTVAQLAGRVRRDHIIRPRCGGSVGHPVAFGADFLSGLEALSGEEGAQSLLIRYRDAVQIHEVDDPGIYHDIDTPAALSALTLSQFPEAHR